MSTSSSTPGGGSPSPGDAATAEVTGADLLDATSLESTLASAEFSEQVSDLESTQSSADSDAAVGDKLAVEDVLPGTNVDDPNLGACLTFERIGNDTVISIDASGAGAAGAVPIVTLQGITDLTLQQLLNDQIIT
jgi:hypothetical protein